ncbi:MAG TPA: rod shape-determining protein [Dehalococcoidia bacterium]|nr:rod shape-determining protein [Dehalococcoidia bacterium]
MLQKHIGIDLGTANVLVYEKGKGIVVNEPSVVALAVRENRIEAVGSEAQAMMGRTPRGIVIIRPMREGVIADYTITEAMLRYFIGKVCGRFRLIRPEVMICMPAGCTSVEQRAVRDAAEQAGAHRPAHLVPEPLAAAIGAQLPVGSPRGNMLVDIGGGRTEAAVISMYGIVVSQSLRVAGDKLDDTIAAYIRRRHNLAIGERMAEEVKKEVGSALPLDTELTCEARGRDQVTGLPRTIMVTSTEITQAISDPVGQIIATVKAVLERTPPELASDIIDQGIVLVGGGSLLRRLDELIAQETGVPCYLAPDPMRCVAIGAGTALEHLDLIKRNLPSEEESLVTSY